MRHDVLPNTVARKTLTVRPKCIIVYPTALAKVWYTPLWKSSINYVASPPVNEMEGP
jgi:hypothetical protein